jgi:superfamily II DNA or RNA helicase
MVSLRDYQEQALYYIGVALDNEELLTFVALPTGTGKAVVAAALASRLLGRGRVLIIAHRIELIDQLAAHARAWCGERRVGVVRGEEDTPGADVIVASIQTLLAKRLDRVLQSNDRPFALAIIDEAHHATIDNSYGQLIGQLPTVPVVGFTATPRTRATAKFKPLFDICVFERSIDAMQRAGWLAPLRQVRVELPIEFHEAPVWRDATGERDYAPAWLRREAEREDVIAALVNGSRAHIAGRPALAFCASVSHAQSLAAAYQEADIRAAAVWGDMPKDQRQAVLDGWRAGRIEVVTNFNVLTEGFDFPELAAIVMARPTQSMPLYLQMLGRGTRMVAGKDDCVIVDAIGLCPDAKQITLRAVVPMENEPPPPGRRGEPHLMLLNPVAAGKWNWNVLAAPHGEPEMFFATADAGCNVDLIPDRAGLWHAMISMRGTPPMPLFDRGKARDQAIYEASQYLRQHSNLQFSERDAAWRSSAEEPTDRQLDFLAKIVTRERLVELVELAKRDRLTKAQISDEINCALARRRLPMIRARLLALRLSSGGD